jgi:uncharacterized damage-inducible protein DinB
MKWHHKVETCSRENPPIAFCSQDLGQQRVVQCIGRYGHAKLHTAIRTLNHIHVVDSIFQAHLRGQAHGFSATNTDATPALAELHFKVAQTDAWFEAYAAALTAQQAAESLAFQFTDGDAGLMTREEMLLHIITHGAYHRGNVGQVLKSISVPPPRDLYTKFLHVHEPARRAGRL